MSWRPIAGRADELPLVLAGPGVRRVEPGGATIFVALRKPDTVTLTVRDDVRTTVASSGAQSTVQLGDNLHVLALTAAPPGGTAFMPGMVYSYVLEFASNRLSGIDSFAAAMGAGNLAAVCYPDAPDPNLPSFCLPPRELDQMKIAHTSCRKAHGEAVDAFPLLDGLLAAASTSSAGFAVARPHQLFLTGDQTYNDDVSDALLAMCIDAAGWLMGDRKEQPPTKIGCLCPGPWSPADVHAVPPYDQPIPGTLKPWGAATDQQWPGVGSRGLHVYAAGFTVTSPQVLAAQEANRPFPINPLGSSPPAPDPWAILGAHSSGSNHLLTLGEFYAMAQLSWSPVLWDDQPSAARVTLPYFDDLSAADWKAANEGDKPTAVKRTAAADRLRDFRAGLDATRRVLANVATYSIFDDHDVTDDWFMNREWCERVLRVPGDTLGLRIIRNALIAYALFQAWGNTPDRFAPGTTGRTLLDALAAGEEMTTDLQALQAGLSQDQVCVSNLVGVPWALVDSGDTAALTRSPQTITWHYTWAPDGWPVEILVADCRTVRGYQRGGLTPPLLLDDVARSAGAPNQLDIQIAAPDHDDRDGLLTLIVLQTPLLGLGPIEFVLGLSDTAKWVFDKDVEVWGASRRAQQGMLTRLVAHNTRTVVLSGDVHYAFAETADYRTATGRSARVVQLTSSSARNEDHMTRSADVVGRIAALLPITWSGSNAPGSVAALTGASGVDQLWTPVLLPAALYTAVFGTTPEWTYREALVPGLPSATQPPTGTSPDGVVTVQNRLIGLFAAPFQQVVVGQNNIGLVDFPLTSAGAPTVRQTMYWRSDSASDVSTASNATAYQTPLSYQAS